MAEPISLNLPPRDPRDELRTKLERAPTEHAEAVLALYEILQGLQDRGALDFVRGTVGSSDKIISDLVEASKTPESIRAFRNLIILGKTMGSIEPETLAALTKSVPEALAETQETEPPSLWELLKKCQSKDFRRGLGAVISVLEKVGKNLPKH